MESKNELIKYKKDNIFSKIFRFLRCHFFKKEEKNEFDLKDEEFFEYEDDDDDSDYFNESYSNLTNNVQVQEKNLFLDKIKVNSNNEKSQQNEKTMFFTLYNSYKKGYVTSKDISLYNLIKINKMLDEEIKIYDEERKESKKKN